MKTQHEVEAPHTTSRLDQIYAQLKELQNYKDEILGDLDEFMEEVEADENVHIPAQFEEVVDIVMNEERDKAERIEELGENSTDQNELAKAMEELAADDANPFWKRFLQPQ